MYSVRRPAFCFLVFALLNVFIIPPLYLRFVRFVEVTYKVAESDVLRIHHGQSNIFCEKHSLRMNSSFKAFQIAETTNAPNNSKHLRLKKSMSLPEDTLEYWGFYLLRGAALELKAWSRFQGSKVLLLKGDKALNTCGLIDNNKNIKKQTVEGIIVTLETPVELIDRFLEADTKKVVLSKNTPAEETLKKADSEAGFDKIANEVISEYANKSQPSRHIKITPNDKRWPKLFPKNEGAYFPTNQQISERIYIVDNKKSEYLHNVMNLSHSSNEDMSLSSLEELTECPNVEILGYAPFPERNQSIKIQYNVYTEGYYYFVFYNNDVDRNEIHAIFDIQKPTFEYANWSESKGCINTTECSFSVSLFTHEVVIVEIPTKDGIKHEEDDLYIFVSTCHPRLVVYIIFPISAVVLILLCSVF